MSLQASAEDWTQRVERVWHAYDEALVRKAGQALVRPRNHWPKQELIDRALATLSNVPVIDRRLAELPAAARQALALMAHSGRPAWPVGSLVEMLVALGHADGLAPIQHVLQAGLLYPFLPELDSAPEKARLRSLDTWLGQGTAPVVFAHPTVLQRCLGRYLDLPPCPGAEELTMPTVLEADGLDWPLRLAALWQFVAAMPLRRTQGGDFFKRDAERLHQDPLLMSPAADAWTALPDPAMLAVALGLAIGVLHEHDGEIAAAELNALDRPDLPGLLAELWDSLLALGGWNPERGKEPVGHAGGNPYPAAYLLALLLLAQLPGEGWARPAEIAQWIVDRHPFWARTDHDLESVNHQPRKKGERAAPKRDHGLVRFLLGIAYPLRLVQAAKHDDGQPLVRLSPLGRWVLGWREQPPGPVAFAQTLLVQPNLEILAYRQGLTPALILQLTRFAAWKTLGAACTLQLGPDSVYRALEASASFETIVQTLERHGMKALPGPVLDALRTWSNKRDRLSVWTSAALFEFPGPAELSEALARGLPAVRLTDRLAVVASEDQIDYQHFRLTGTRDYCLPPEPCVEAEADGVTLSVDLARSDLLLESEVQRFAEPRPGPAPPGRKLYQVTPASAAAGRQNGLTVPVLETWFQQRTGQSLTPAARLLVAAAVPLELRRHMVLHVASADLAEGLLQWPATSALIQSRLGPTALVVAEADAPALAAKVRELGWELRGAE